MGATVGMTAPWQRVFSLVGRTILVVDEGTALGPERVQHLVHLAPNIGRLERGRNRARELQLTNASSASSFSKK